MRTDIHKPSSINPTDYTFIGFKYVGSRVIEKQISLHYKQIIEDHMKQTGGNFSDHQHGGSCQVCGANSHYLGVFYHSATNQYIQTGYECADKMSLGDSKAFKAFRKQIKDSADFMTGKKKAEQILQDSNLQSCWEIYLRSPEDRSINSEHIIASIVSNLVRYGSLSMKQEEYLRHLLGNIDVQKGWAAAREEQDRIRQETAEDCPEGRIEVLGTVVSVKEKDTQFGYTLKMLVESTSGFRVWGSVPSSLKCLLFSEGGELTQRTVKRGDKIKFSATVSPSDEDKKFGFFSKPTKANIILESN